MTYLTVPFFHYVFGVLPIWPAWLAATAAGLYLILFKERFDPRTTVFWIAVLFALPVAGLLVYLYCGSTLGSRIVGGSKARREASYFGDDGISEPECGELEGLARSFGADVCVGGSRASLNWSGSEGENAFLDAVKTAKRSIHIEARRLASGDFGRRLTGELCEKACSGVDVRLLTSSYGFGRTPGLRTMKRAGILHSTLRPRIVAALSIRTFDRDLRDFAVMDGTTAFLGTDAFVALEGRAASRMGARFLADWAHAARAPFDPMPDAVPSGDDSVQAIPSGPDSGDAMLRTCSALISGARRSLYLAFPFMIPGDEMYDSIRQAALAGTEVVLLLPVRCRHWYQKWNSLASSGPLTDAGVKVFFSRRSVPGTIAVADRDVCIIGTGVYNSRSLDADYTINVMVRSRRFASVMSDRFTDEIAGAAELTFEDYQGRSFADQFKIAVSRMLMFLNRCGDSSQICL